MVVSIATQLQGSIYHYVLLHIVEHPILFVIVTQHQAHDVMLYLFFLPARDPVRESTIFLRNVFRDGALTRLDFHPTKQSYDQTGTPISGTSSPIHPSNYRKIVALHQDYITFLLGFDPLTHLYYAGDSEFTTCITRR